MKSPHAPRPSGDRRLARLFIDALRQAGFRVEIASELRSWEGQGDASVQELIRQQGAAEASRLITDYMTRPQTERPCAWFTYHLYHKSPDWIGPEVAGAIKIPYIVAEASVAEKQRGGRWQSGFLQVLTSLAQARVAFVINPQDRAGIVNKLANTGQAKTMLPFLNPPGANGPSRHDRKQRLGARLKIDPDRYWLLCVAMMRDDAKFASYQLLAAALDRVERSDWSLLVVGDGAAQTRVRELFRYDNARQIFFLGRRDEATITDLMGAADLLVWPAVNEAIGMVALEAMANGLPVVWGKSGGIEAIVEHEVTGVLVDPDAETPIDRQFAIAVEGLLADPARLAAMSAKAQQRFRERHDIAHAAALLGNTLTPLIDNK